MKITFKPLASTDISLLQSWLKQPHVGEFWSESNDLDKLREKFLMQLPARGFHPFVVHLNENPIGHIQYYEACRIGGGWWPDAQPGIFGMDCMIGEPEWVGKGIGSIVIERFIHFFCQREQVREIIIDPDSENQKAIRAFEKAGFTKVGIVETPNGCTMLMKRLPPN